MAKRIKRTVASWLLPWAAWVITGLPFSTRLSRLLDRLLLAAEDET